MEDFFIFYHLTGVSISVSPPLMGGDEGEGERKISVKNFADTTIVFMELMLVISE